jgi:hypothetical protein
MSGELTGGNILSYGRLGEFDDVHEAGRYAEEMRMYYCGEFAGED